MVNKQNQLLVLSTVSFIFISVFAIFQTSNNRLNSNQEIEWKVVERDNLIEIYIVGSSTHLFVGADIYLEFNNKYLTIPKTYIGNYYKDTIKIVWNDSKKQYSFFFNPDVQAEILPSEPILVIENSKGISILPNSLVYLKNIGGIYPKVR